MPRLYDDLPMAGLCTLSIMACAWIETPSRLGGARSPQDAGHGAATAVAVPYGAARRRSRSAVRTIFAAPLVPMMALAPATIPRASAQTTGAFSRLRVSGGCGWRCCRAAPSAC